MVQWLGFQAFNTMAGAQSLVRELRFPQATRCVLKKKNVKRDVVTSNEEPQEQPTAKVTRVVRRKGAHQTFLPSSNAEF